MRDGRPCLFLIYPCQSLHKPAFGPMASISARASAAAVYNSITTTRRLCVFYPCGLSSSSSSWEGSNCTLSTRNVPCAIKWSVCTTTTLVGDTYSRTLVHARVRCTRGRGTAYTIPRTLDASVQALRRSLILGQMKTCILKRRNPLSKADK